MTPDGYLNTGECLFAKCRELTDQLGCRKAVKLGTLRRKPRASANKWEAYFQWLEFASQHFLFAAHAEVQRTTVDAIIACDPRALRAFQFLSAAEALLALSTDALAQSQLAALVRLDGSSRKLHTAGASMQPLIASWISDVDEVSRQFDVHATRLAGLRAYASAAPLVASAKSFSSAFRAALDAVMTTLDVLGAVNHGVRSDIAVSMGQPPGKHGKKRDFLLGKLLFILGNRWSRFSLEDEKAISKAMPTIFGAKDRLALVHDGAGEKGRPLRYDKAYPRGRKDHAGWLMNFDAAKLVSVVEHTDARRRERSPQRRPTSHL